jgi:hypothetical protein
MIWLNIRNVISNSGSMNTDIEDDSYDDSRIAMNIAVKTSIFVSVSFFIIWLIQFYLPRLPFDAFIELVLRVFLVIFWLVISKWVLIHVKGVSNVSGIPFLSTVFFYGMTLLMVTVLQLGLIIFHLIFSDVFSFIEELRMLFGIRSFSVNAIFYTFIIGHIPYIVYFFYLRFILYRMYR